MEVVTAPNFDGDVAKGSGGLASLGDREREADDCVPRLTESAHIEKPG